MMRVADYIAQELANHGITHAFLVTGGGAMHLNDAIGMNKLLEFSCFHNEQSCAIAAESYYRLTNKLALVNVTTGPGGTNAITGVYGAWTDSIGMLVVSGQVKFQTTVQSTGLKKLRQLGDQEGDLIAMVKPITKYAIMVTDAKSIKYHLQKALYLAVNGRPAPVWLDIPLDVQAARINPDELEGFDPAELTDNDENELNKSAAYYTYVKETAGQIYNKLLAAKRPVLMVGSGIRLSGAYDRFIELATILGIPVCTAWNAHDAIWNDHPGYAGRPGILGERAGNLTIQNADLLLSIGCRLSIRQVSYDWKKFARHAYKIMVDIDATELKKPTLNIDMPVHADLADLIDELLVLAKNHQHIDEHHTWMQWSRKRQEIYPVVQPQYWEHNHPINPYCFIDALFKQLPEDANIVCANGSAAVMTFQAAHIKKGQRLYHNSGSAPMGYDLPAAIGACLATNRKEVFCLTGDGSIMMNLQELQTIVTCRLPIKILLINNAGYHSIRQTQTNFFAPNFVGFDEPSGVGFPNFSKIAYAFDLPYSRIEKVDELEDGIKQVLAAPGAHFCEVFVDPAQVFSPKLSSKRLEDGSMESPPLEDMFPFLSREELRSTMIVPLFGEE